jgi:hypothetical protein
MIFKSPLISVGSGKLAGSVITRGRGNSLVLRKLSIPTNPSSAAQSVNRTFFAGLAGTWATVLTALQRSGWEAYAASVTLINKLGDAAHISGISMYIRCNQIRLTAAILSETQLERIDDAPGIHTLGSPPDLSTIAWNGTTPFGPTWAIPKAEPDSTGSIAFKFSSGQNAGRNFFKGPFNTWDYEAISDPTTAGPDLADVEAVAGPLLPGQTLFVSAAALYDDGRCSNPSIARVIVGDVE